ncbi:MAG: histidine kinase [Burkholderiaceae bacterium]
MLWSAAAGAMESVLPHALMHPTQFAMAALQPVPGWLFMGVLVVTSTSLAVPRLSPPQLVLLCLGLAVFLSLLRTAFPVPFMSLGDLEIVRTMTPVVVSPVYLTWGQFLYAGLFMGAGALAHRTERTQQRLAQAEIARSRSEALFSQAQLTSLDGSLDPAFLVRVLDQMQARYASNAASADRLLDALVTFLRVAMPGVRSGQSTLAAELDVVRSYAQLWAELDPGRARWRCHIDGALADLAFPPLLLLPVLDQLAASLPGRAPLSVSATIEASRVTLSLHGRARAGWLTDELLHRLRVGLHVTHGPAANVVLGVADASGGPALTLSLPLHNTLPGATTARLLTPTPPGVPPWTNPARSTT